MEPLLKSLRELPRRFRDLPAGVRLLLGAMLVVVVGVVALVSALSGGAGYQYVFTNLTAEDSTEAASALKGAGIPFQAEANGSALSVPASKVHDARLLLAAQGLPRGGGVGFELFDRGDFGTSEFTQRVNLRRATEGELGRTISRLSAVRSARVHLTLPEKGLYRDDDKRASAAVVLHLQPGRVMQERELAGIRHLAASAVAGLEADKVTIVDQRGTVLSGDRSESARLASQQREIESMLEQRIVDLLEPAVGAGAVVAKVTASIDTSEVETTADSYDPDSATVRSERKTSELITSDGTTGSGVAGAAANQPLGAAGGGGAGSNRAQTSREDETKNYEIGKKVTRTVTRTPRILKVSAAVLVNNTDGKTRAEAEMRRLADLARHAMGFDAQRGDRFDISSAAFTKRDDEGTKLAVWERPELINLAKMIGTAGLVIAAILFLLRRGKQAASTAMAMLRPGASVAELEAAMGRPQLEGYPGGTKALPDGTAAARERARELGKGDPARAAHLIKAWIAADSEMGGNHRG